jgi:cytochrome d ubiquinol oxidase subunit I
MAIDASTMAVFDRALFAFTIATHIIVVCTTIGLAIVISVAEYLSISRKDKHFGALWKRLSKVLVISFGVGTASGIVMAVEMVMLFPGFMTLVSQTGVIAIFYAEVFAFFLETIALVMYVYYPDRLKGKYTHWSLSLVVLVGTLLSAVLIIMVNAWMNTPNGFDIGTYIQTGTVTGVNAWAPFSTSSTLSEEVHAVPTVALTGLMIVAAFFMWFRQRSTDVEERKMLNKGLKITTTLGIFLIVVAVLSGMNEITTVLHDQPLKYSALELDPNPGSNLAERVFGSWPNAPYGQPTGGILIPGAQSFLLQIETGNSSGPGLSEFPNSNWPPLWIHTTFDLMVVGGMLLGLFFLFCFFYWWILRRDLFESKIFTYGMIPVSIFTLIILEDGWVTAEVGRQPWIVYNVLTVQQAANNSTSILIPGLLIVAFYLIIVPVSYYFMARIYRAHPPMEKDEATPEDDSPGEGGDP